MSELERIPTHLANITEFNRHYSAAMIQARAENVSSVTQAISSGTGEISVLKKAHGTESVHSKVEIMIYDLQKSFNLNQKLSPDQIKETAREICESFYILSLEELAYCFRKAKRGDYGQVKFALNQFDIIGWVSQYQEERIQEFVKDSGREQRHMKTNLNDTEIEFLSEFKACLPPDKEQEYREFKESGAKIELVDTSENEELQDLKRKLNEQYGISESE